MSPGQPAAPTAPSFATSISNLAAAAKKMKDAQDKAAEEGKKNLPEAPNLLAIPPQARGVGPFAGQNAGFGGGSPANPIQLQQAIGQQMLSGGPGGPLGSTAPPLSLGNAPLGVPGAPGAAPGGGASGISPLYATGAGGAPGTSLSGLNADMQNQLYQLMLQQQMSGMA
jgi:hypothetical protein